MYCLVNRAANGDGYLTEYPIFKVPENDWFWEPLGQAMVVQPPSKTRNSQELTSVQLPMSIQFTPVPMIMTLSHPQPQTLISPTAIQQLQSQVSPKSNDGQNGT